MEFRVAKVISYLFHPLLMPTVCLFLALYINSYISFTLKPEGKSIIILMVFILTFLLPSVIILFLIKRGVVKNIEMDNLQDRILPYLITAVFYYTSYRILKNFNLPYIIRNIFLGATMSVIIALLINIKWKISAHMVGIGGLTGFIIVLSQHTGINLNLYLIISVLLSGLIGFSRLKLNAHNPSQVYTGFLAGLSVMLIFILA
ncbi:MAG: hypothetical protein PHD97_11190 [Bacteroidales bacterium]|nr:hypothetical protein [Bacteroidales bacterium]